MKRDLKDCRRIMIVGTSCTGKSTLAQKLGQTYGFHVIDSDELAWQPQWRMTPRAEYSAILNQEIQNEPWIFAGNIGSAEDFLVEKVDAIIWLDYPFWLVLWRGFQRAVYRITTRQVCCNGNIETMAHTFFSKDSILLWIIKSYPKWRTAYEKFQHKVLDRNLLFLRVKSPRELDFILGE